MNEEELLRTIACYRDCEDATEALQAETAFRELLEQHEENLWKLASKVIRDYSTWGFDPQELYTWLIERIWRKAEHFSPKAGSDEESVMKQFIGWAAAILENRVCDDLRAVKLDLDPRELEEISESLFIRAASDRTDRVTAVEAALEMLPPGDQEVLRALVIEYRPRGGQIRTPVEEQRALAKRLGVAVATVRQRRKRALAKLKSLLEAHPIFK